MKFTDDLNRAAVESAKMTPKELDARNAELRFRNIANYKVSNKDDFIWAIHQVEGILWGLGFSEDELAESRAFVLWITKRLFYDQHDWCLPCITPNRQSVEKGIRHYFGLQAHAVADLAIMANADSEGTA